MTNCHALAVPLVSVIESSLSAIGGLVSRLATRALLAMSVPLASSACSDPLGPETELVVLVSAPEFMALGDTVQLTGVAFNGGSTTIEASRGCGPGIGMLVVDSTGTETDLHGGLLWTCQVRDSNLLQPGETDVVEWSWTPPDTGVYFVQSVVWVRDGPTIRSTSIEVTVINNP